MIEQLIKSEGSYNGPEFHKLSEEIVQLKQQLGSQLNQQGKEHLDQLTDIYLEQSTALLKASFIDGFCTAVDLALDYLEHRNISRSKANQQQPPES